MNCVSESCSVTNECRILQTCNSAYSDGYFEPPNKKLKRINIWNYFVKIDKNGKEMCECKTCGKLFVCGGRSGMSHLNQHIPVCPLIMKSRIAENFGLKALDHNMIRESMTQMIIKHYLPFRFVEWDKFRSFTKFVSHNEAQVFNKDDVVADVMKVYLIEKDKLKKQLSMIESRVCLSFRCWTSSASSRRFVSLTAHYMDDRWNLITKLLNFCHLELDSPHDNCELSRKVFGFLQDWGIEKNIFSITVDNASTKDDDLQNLKHQLCSLESLLCNGDYFYFKCCAGVLDFMVQESLKVVSDLLDKIRKSVKYVSVSNSRLKQFYQCVEEVGGGDDSDGLHLDVSGKWVSTYMMLKNAIKYRTAFECMCLNDTAYSDCPSSEEWERGEKICEFLKNFYGLTNIVSGSAYPTSDTHLHHIWGIESSLQKLMLCEDDKIRDMASKMLNEFDKHLSEYSMILAFGCVLNPFLKFKYLEYLYEKLGHDTETVKAKVNNVRKAIYALFNEYANKSASNSSSLSVVDPPSSTSTQQMKPDKFMIEYREYIEKKRQERYAGGVTQLDLYLKETDRGYRNALQYWKYYENNYDILAKLARDVLSIPIITVASESAFSHGSYILNKYRSCMLSENLQALVCSHNWLFGFSPSDQYEDVIEDTRKIGINLTKQESKCHCVHEIRTDDS